MSSQKCVKGMCVGGLLAALVAAGCASESYSVGPTRTPEQRSKAFPIEHDAWAKLGYQLDWQGYPAVTGSLPVQFVRPYDDIVVALEKGSTVSILEATTGSRRCSEQLSSPLTRFVGISREGSMVECASDDEVFTVDAATCNLVGRQRIEKIVRTEPVSYGNLLIFGTGSGELLAHLKSARVGGVKAWGFMVEGAIERNPVLIGQAVGAVSQTGQVIFVDAGSGSLLGRNFVYTASTTNPVADENLMYVASMDQSLYAFSPVGGQLLWRHRTATPLTVQPTAHGGRVYCTIPGEGLTAFDGATGKVLWRCKEFGGTVVAMNKNRLVSFDKAAGEAATIDPERGDVIERTKLANIVMLKPDRFVDGNLYALSTSSVIAKFHAR